jgi:hypothetical protein
LPAKLTAASVMVPAPFRLPGRAVCPALGPRGRFPLLRSSATTSTTDRTLQSCVIQLRCCKPVGGSSWVHSSGLGQRLTVMVAAGL